MGFYEDFKNISDVSSLTFLDEKQDDFFIDVQSEKDLDNIGKLFDKKIEKVLNFIEKEGKKIFNIKKVQENFYNKEIVLINEIYKKIEYLKMLKNLKQQIFYYKNEILEIIEINNELKELKTKKKIEYLEEDIKNIDKQIIELNNKKYEIQSEIYGDGKKILEYKNITKDFLKYAYLVEGKNLNNNIEYKNIENVEINFGEYKYLKDYGFNITGYIKNGNDRFVIIKGEIFDLVGETFLEKRNLYVSNYGKNIYKSKILLEQGKLEFEKSKKYILERKGSRFFIRKRTKKELNILLQEERKRKEKMIELNKKYQKEEKNRINKLIDEFSKIALIDGIDYDIIWRDFGFKNDYKAILESDIFSKLELNEDKKKEILLGLAQVTNNISEDFFLQFELDSYDEIFKILRKNKIKKKNSIWKINKNLGKKI